MEWPVLKCIRASFPSFGHSIPSHCPVRASVRLMTMSISVAPSATAMRTSCRRVSSGVWPAGKPVATGKGGRTRFEWNLSTGVHFLKRYTQSHSHSHTLQLTLIPLPEATGRLELAAFRDATASATRDGYTHTAAVVTPDTQNNNTCGRAVRKKPSVINLSVSPSAGWIQVWTEQVPELLFTVKST